MIWAGLKTAWFALSGLWNALPAGAKKALIIGLCIVLLVGYHFAALKVEHYRGVKEGAAQEDAKWQKKEDARIALQRKADDAAQAKLDHVAAIATQEQLDHQDELAALEQKHQTELAALKARKESYALNLLVGAYVPRGYLLFRADAAAFANGIALQAPSGLGQDPGGPSGVSFSALADDDIAQANAYRAAVQWGRTWQSAARDVKKQCQQTIDALTGANS